MARIPSAEELGFRAPRAVAQGADTGGVISGRARAMDLKAVETGAAQKGLKELGDRIANEELATAEVQFQLGAMAEAEKYKNDPELDTIEERHAAGMQEQLGKASSKITSAKTRALFITRGEAAVAQANANMRDKTTGRKNDKERGHMANDIDLMVKGGMDLEYGDPGTAAVGIQLTLDSMVERDVISAVDGQKMMKRAQLDMAYGRLKSMDPAQQLEMLNSPDAKTQRWLADVPPDVLRSLKDEALRQEQNGRALNLAFEMSDMDEADGLAKLEQDFINGDLSDEDYEKTRVRYLRVKSDQDTQQLQLIDDYLEDGMAEIAYGTTSIAQLEKAPGGIEMLKKMTEAQRNNLYAAEENAMKRAAGQGRKYSDWPAKSQLRELLATDQNVKARKFWSENSALFADGDWKYFNSATSPTKSSAASFKPLQTTNQLMSDYLDAHPLDEEGERDLWDALSGQAEQYFIQEQKNPEPALIRQWVKDKHANIVLDKPTTFLGMEFGGEEFLERDITPEQRRIVKPITNVYQAGGMTGEAAIKQFNAMSAPERSEFTRRRLKAPGMDPVEFLGKWQRGLKKYRTRLEANKRALAGRGIAATEDAGA